MSGTPLGACAAEVPTLQTAKHRLGPASSDAVGAGVVLRLAANCGSSVALTMLAHRMGRHVHGLCMATAASDLVLRVRESGRRWHTQRLGWSTEDCWRLPHADAGCSTACNGLLHPRDAVNAASAEAWSDAIDVAWCLCPGSPFSAFASKR